MLRPAKFALWLTKHLSARGPQQASGEALTACGRFPLVPPPGRRERGAMPVYGTMCAADPAEFRDFFPSI
ncbi:MAG: hypothetical protein Kow0032_01090 [Methyloligellaceae bacterium]